MSLMDKILEKAFYLYDYEPLKVPLKKCVKEKCEHWRGVDSEGLVWCDDWNVGDCKSYNHGEPYGKQLVRVEDTQNFLSDVMSKEHALRKLWEERPRGKNIYRQYPKSSIDDRIRIFFREYTKWEMKVNHVFGEAFSQKGSSEGSSSEESSKEYTPR